MDFSEGENDSYNHFGSSCDANIALLIPGIIICAVSLIDMIVLYAVPTAIANKNKKNLPDAKFEKPKPAIIVFHFLEHIFLLALGVMLILDSMCDYGTSFLIWGPTVPGILFLICYIVLLVFGTKTRTYNSQLTSEQMTEKLTIQNPVEYIFIYTEGTEIDEDCHYDDGVRKCKRTQHTCYSKSGVKFPVVSQRKTEPYNFSNVPDLFYFNYKHVLSKASDVAGCIYDVSNEIRSCRSKYHNPDVIGTNPQQENYPVQEGTYVITRKKLPSPMNKASRICCMLFGSTVFYEIYTKSIPYIDFAQEIDVHLQNEKMCPSINIDCDDVGRCSRFNSKPKP